MSITLKTWLLALVISAPIAACAEDRPANVQAKESPVPAAAKSTPKQPAPAAETAKPPAPVAKPPAEPPAQPKVAAQPEPALEPAPAVEIPPKSAAEPAPKSATDLPPAEPVTEPLAAVDPALTAIREFITSKEIDKTKPNWKTALPMPPKATFDATKKYFWLLNTSEGPIKIRLMTEVAPMHVSSTIYLTELGFYDGLSFHRVIPGFMAQGGDPLGSGMGSPGYRFAGEFSPTVKHDRPGLLSAANAGPNTDGSQFFLTFVATPHLDGKHSISGEVVEGLENLKKLEKFGSAGGQTSKPLKIETAKIVVE